MRMNGYLSPHSLCRMAIVGLLLMNMGCCAANGYMVNRSGMKQYARGHYALARHRFAKAVASDPGNPDYRHNLAMALQKQGDLAGSEKILRHNLTMNAMHQPTYHSLAQLMISQGRAPEAQELLTAWVATQPYVPEANIEMAWLQRETGDLAGAEQSLQQALKANPTNAIALSHMGQLYQTAGRQDEAVAYYQRSLAAHWDQPEVQSRLATMTEPGSVTRSAMMQTAAAPMMASAPVMTQEPMLASTPMPGGNNMISATQVSMSETMVADPSSIPLATSPMPIVAGMDASNPFGNTPDAVALEDLRSNPAPQHARRKGRWNRRNQNVASTYPLPDFGSAPTTAWVPAGTIGGPAGVAYQPVGGDPTMMALANPQISPPSASDSISTPYVTNYGSLPVPQADPAHFGQSNPDMTAAVPTVDPH